MGAFHKKSLVLLSKAVPLSKRMVYFTRTVHPALFWCSGSWNLTVSQLAQLRHVQQSMYRKMLRARRDSGETLEEYMVRTNRKIKHLKDIMERNGDLLVVLKM